MRGAWTVTRTHGRTRTDTHSVPPRRGEQSPPEELRVAEVSSQIFGGILIAALLDPGLRRSADSVVVVRRAVWTLQRSVEPKEKRAIGVGVIKRERR